MTPRHRAGEIAILVIVVGILIFGIVYTINESRNAKTHEPLIEMKTDLLRLRQAEELFFDDSGRYAADLDGSFHSFSPSLSKPSSIVSTKGYSATVTHSRLPNAICGMAVGARNPVADAPDGEATCRRREK
jgi:Tfp pilus assembly protein PilE